MQSCIVKLSPDSFDFVRSRIESGRYENTNEVMLAALRALHREEIVSKTKCPSSHVAEGDVFRKLWENSGHSAWMRRESAS